jgi:hypothetical protein
VQTVFLGGAVAAGVAAVVAATLGTTRTRVRSATASDVRPVGL